MEERKPRKTIFTLILIFAILFTYIFLNSIIKSGGCGGIGRGNPAPPFTLENLEGQQVTLEQFKGNVLVLNFWASWCTPCRKELPSLQSLYKKLKDRENFAFLAVSCDEEGKKPVQDLFSRYTIDIPVALDPNRKIAFLYGVSKFPETYFIDKDGKVRHKFIGPWDWTDRKFIDILEKMLAE